MQTDKIIIPFVKSSGITSFNSLRSFKLLHKKTKVGHTGVLDSFADGLMVGLIGKGTKLSTYFTNCDKTYITCFVFGCETDTLDCIGKIVARGDLPKSEAVLSVIKNFIGRQQQIPPLYSRVSINGIRAHEAAQAGKYFKIPAREIEVYSIDVLDYKTENSRIKSINLKIQCSKGTYIRAICRDIARAVNSRAFVLALRRTELANLKLKDALWANRLPSFNKQVSILNKNIGKLELPVILKKPQLFNLTLPEYEAYAMSFTPSIAQSVGLPVLQLQPKFAKQFKLGQKIKPYWFTQTDKQKNYSNSIEISPSEKSQAVFCKDDFYGIVSFKERYIKYNFVF